MFAEMKKTNPKVSCSDTKQVKFLKKCDKNYHNFKCLKKFWQ